MFYLLDDLLTRVSLSVLHDGVRVPADMKMVHRLLFSADRPASQPLNAGTHLKITASLSSHTVGSADLPFVGSSAKS